MAFQYLLALHMLFVVIWFSGLNYILRLFIYQSEAEIKEEPAKTILQSQYKIMQKRVWYITWLSMIFTVVFGVWFIILMPHFLQEAYFILSICFFGGLVLYHLQCHIMYKQLQKDIVKHSSVKLRLWNELSAIFLVAIIFLLVLQTNTGLVYGVLGLIIFAGTLLLAIKLFRNSNEKNN